MDCRCGKASGKQQADDHKAKRYDSYPDSYSEGDSCSDIQNVIFLSHFQISFFFLISKSDFSFSFQYSISLFSYAKCDL